MARRKGKRRYKKSNISYQNKDILGKLAAEYLKDKSLNAYGLNLPKITGILPTNLPAIEANELRLDNLFQFEDDSVGIIDYESTYDGKRQKIKYLNYVARIAERYRREGLRLDKLHIIIIYTADVSPENVSTEYDIGCVKLKIQPAFLSNLKADDIMDIIRRKIDYGEELDETEQMQFIVMPLSRKGKAEKIEAIREEIELAKKIKDDKLSLFLMSSLLVFCDKVIDKDMSEQIRGWIEMTKIGRIIEKEKQAALRKQEEEKEEEKQAALRMKDEEKKIMIYSLAKKLIKTLDMSDEDIIKMLDVLSPAQVRSIREEVEAGIC